MGEVVTLNSLIASLRNLLLVAFSIGVVASSVCAQEYSPDDPEISEEGRRALSLTGDPAEGARTYQSCSVCHLASGGGSVDGIFPQLAGQHRTVVIKQLTDIRSGRRQNPVMAPYAAALTDPREIADVAAYIETLSILRENGQGSGDELDLGARLYAQDCAACHGRRGEGDAAGFRPVLAGQHYAYLLRQVQAIAADRRGNAHPRMKALVASYHDAELRAVLDYVSRLEWPRRPPAPPGD